MTFNCPNCSLIIIPAATGGQRTNVF
uniref:Uncharacterized protein n=1 Tax=Medicago truncatula TaxID=3880 RepID=I3SSM8_MEDTR|nr:unknown [Medicago truncatula]